jgi:hypothetical protein
MIRTGFSCQTSLDTVTLCGPARMSEKLLAMIDDPRAQSQQPIALSLILRLSVAPPEAGSGGA